MSMFINLTPHTVNLNVDGKNLSFRPSGNVPRVVLPAGVRENLSVETPDDAGMEAFSETPIPTTVLSQTPGVVEGLPEPTPDTFYIVSRMVLDNSRRTDLVAPDTGPTAIRENGQIKAVRGFVKY